jgi:pyruvate-ferredoxin/flavodoxin oxidoreductase
MARKLKTMDGNTAAAHVAYAFTEVAAIYPITPSSTMAEYVDKWSAGGQKNIFGQPVKVLEMQSEAGAAGAVHGSLLAGALTSTFTASQGLLLMIPNMYKWAGEQLPAVIHVSARTVAAHALSIFGDHSDVMACRQTGFAMLAANSPQEVMDLAAVAHLSAIRSQMPFLHFFDGFRTSHEMQKIEVWNYDDLAEMIDYDALNEYRSRAHNPNHPVLRGSAQNGDIYFQARESINNQYVALPEIVEGYMNTINKKLGTDYKPFNYYGAPDAKHVIVAMGSVCEAAEEVVDYLNASGQKVGLVKVRLFRPFSTKHLLSVLPKTVESVGVLDRTKEPGSIGEPLYLDVVTALNGSGIKVVGGRYGLASKDTTPGQIIAAYKNIQEKNPKNGFTLGITDDVTNLSLPIVDDPDTTPKDIISCKFWGLGSDGTVGANKNSIKIIGDHTDLKAQAYFQYDSRKSGGVTISHLRFGKSPIKSTYYISKANFVACHNPSYLEKFDMVQDVKPGGAFLANCAWDVDELDKRLPADAKKYIADNNIRFYTCDAEKIARELGLGNKTNAILQAAFFKLSEILPIDEATEYMKKAVRDTYGRKGEDIVNMNIKAIDAGLESLVKVDVPASWKSPAPDHKADAFETDRGEDVKKYVCEVMEPMNLMRGDKLPVSAFLDTDCGSVVPAGLAGFEKRKIAADVPCWIPENCIQCNQCAYVCPHAVIRPFVFNDDEAKNAPEGTKMVPMTGKGNENYKFAIIPTVFDCTGCGSCANVCPAKNKALVMKPLDEQAETQKSYDYAVKNVTDKETGFAVSTVKGSQFKKPLLEFPGACAGCGESPYARLVTQLFGDRMYIANATGCTSIWGGSAPTTPYTVNAEGKGPAWANSLFEDNAEFGLGMATASEQRRDGVRLMASELSGKVEDAAVKAAIDGWVAAFDDAEGSKTAGKALEAALEKALGKSGDFPYKTQLQALYNTRDQFVKPSVWIFGGDGWAYDIGYGGLDHVIASGQNVNILVFDTEVYSNTGGQASKSTPTGAVAQFAAAGKSVKKKDLAQIAMAYGYVYVAQVSMGANYQQTLKALMEAESYDGPSLIIAYAPCINHGIRAGMGKSITEMKNAVESGYWNMLRYDPRLAAEGKNPLQVDSKEATSSYRDFIMGEVRYSSLKLEFPDRAEQLFTEAEQQAKARYEALVKQKEMLEPKK